MRAILRVACVLVLVGSSATAEPQEGDAYLDKERGIALDIKASFGEEREKNLSAAADLGLPPISGPALKLEFGAG